MGPLGAIRALVDARAAGAAGRAPARRAEHRLMGTLEAIGLIVDALLASAAVLAPAVRARGVATLGAAVLTPVLLVDDLGASDRLDALTGRPLVLVAGAAIALAVL